HQRHGDGRGVSIDDAGAADAGRADVVSGRRARPGAGTDRARRQTHGGAGESRSAAEAAARRPGARAVRSGQSKRGAIRPRRPVQLEFDIVNKVYPDGATAYNAIAEIPGSDRRDEVVMLGGHLDSWHSATGATDNAIGCAVMMEAARILKAIGVVPRRTIRVALWSGEEEGLLGSLAYVKEHFGSAEDPKPEFAKLDAYLNIDS